MDEQPPQDDDLGVDTLLQHLGEEQHYAGAVVQPLFQNSLFVFERCADLERALRSEVEPFAYTRISNPTTALAEKKIAALEGTEACRLFASGMGALSAAVLSNVRTNAAYGPTKSFLLEYLPKFDVQTTLVDGTDVHAVEAAIQGNTELLYLETPGSVTFAIQDLEAMVKMARRHGITTICDNSTVTPVFQRPASFGVDLVVHSATKCLSGHSDVVAGCVCGSSERIHALTWSEGQYLGASIDPFAAWLLTRSLRTLPIRMQRHQRSATEVALFLQGHPAVEVVNYPGLADHPACALIEKQMAGASGMLSFRLVDGTKESAFAFCESLRLFQIGVSWGGHESLAIPIPPSDGDTWVIRLSIGLEAAPDLIADLRRALDEQTR